MASLQSRLSSLITAIGADIKALQARTAAAQDPTTISSTAEPTKAVEWWYTSTGVLIGKLITIVPVVSSVVQDRGEMYARVRSRTGGATHDRLVIDSDGKSGFTPITKTVVKASDQSAISTEAALSVSDTITVSGPKDVVLVWLNARASPGGGANANGVRIRLYVDAEGSARTSFLLENFLNTGQSQSPVAGGISIRITGLSAGTHTLAMKAARSSGTSTSTVYAEGTAMTYMVIPYGDA